MPEIQRGGLHHVAAARGREGLRQCVRCVELHEAVTRSAGEPALDGGERPVEGGIHGLRVVAVGGVGDRVRVEGHRDRVTARGVDRRGIGTAVAAAATAVAVHGGIQAGEDLERAGHGRGQHGPHEHRVPGRVGDIVGLQAVLPALRRADHPARHPGRVEGPDRVRHVATLEVGEGGPIGHDVLERLDVRVVDRRVVDVRQDAVGDGEPGLRGPIPGGPQAILAGEVEMGEGSGGVRRRADSECHPGRTGRRRDREHEGADRAQGKKPSATAAAGSTVMHRVPPRRDSGSSPFP